MSTEQLHTYTNLAVQARNRLVQHNIRIVDHWARRLIQHSNAGKDVSYYELVAEGLIGLTKAAECYQPGRVRFYTHAEIYIRSELYKGLTKLRAGSHASHKVMTNIYVYLFLFFYLFVIYLIIIYNLSHFHIPLSLSLSLSCDR